MSRLNRLIQIDHACEWLPPVFTDLFLRHEPDKIMDRYYGIINHYSSRSRVCFKLGAPNE